MDVSRCIAWLRALPVGAVSGCRPCRCRHDFLSLGVLTLLGRVVVAPAGHDRCLGAWSGRSGSRGARDSRREEEGGRGAAAGRSRGRGQMVQAAQIACCGLSRRFVASTLRTTGVARSQLAEGHTAGRRTVPPLRRRRHRPAARKRLQSDGLVLLVGTPASGVTRTAYIVLTVPTSPLILVQYRRMASRLLWVSSICCPARARDTAVAVA